MKSEKELLKEKIDKKYKFYEEMCMNGIAEVVIMGYLKVWKIIN